MGETIHVKRIQVKDLKAIKDLDVQFPEAGDHLLISGANNQGKTTLASVASYLISKKTRPAKPLREGAEAGYAKLTTDSGVEIHWEFSATDDSLTVTDETGKEISAPKFLKRLAGAGGFDVEEFLALQPKQKAMYLQKRLGIDTTAIDQRYGVAYDRRADCGRAVDSQAARALPYDQNLLNIPDQNTGELVTELARMHAENLKYQQQQDAITADSQTLNGYGVKLQELQQQEVALKNEFTRIQQALAENRAAQAQVTQSGNLLNAAIIEKHSVLPAAPPHSPAAIFAVQQQINSADAIRSQREAAIRLKAEHDELARLKERYEAMKAEVEAIDNERRAMLAAVPMPADGLRFTPAGDLLLNDLPFDDTSISTSAKIIAACQMAFAFSGDLKLVHIDASLLDRKNLNRVIEWANAVGAQLAIERVELDGEGLRLEFIH